MKGYIIKRIAIVLSLILFLFTVAGCGNTKSTMSKIKSKKVIVMGTNAEFPPFEFRNDKGEVDGIDASLAKEIAKELGVELKIEDMAFDSLLNALNSGKIDFVAAGMSVTEDRLANNDFSNPYYTAGQMIIVKKGSEAVKGKADLNGKKIGVQEGTTGDIEASKVPGAQISRFKKAIDAVLDLKNGKIDAVVLDESPSKVFVSKNDDIMILDEKLTDEEYAIAVRKGDKELLDSINKTIAKLKENGKYSEIVAKYYSE